MERGDRPWLTFSENQRHRIKLIAWNSKAARMDFSQMILIQQLKKPQHDRTNSRFNESFSMPTAFLNALRKEHSVADRSESL
jgi:hypothetical protein